MRLFADDTALYLTMESEDDSSALQTDLDILSAWETRWDMEFNPSKCQVVHVTGFRKTVKTDYVLHGQVLESVPCARYLGVDISSGLTWNSHIDRVTANAYQTLGFIRRNIKTKMPKVREAAYDSHCKTPVRICFGCLGSAHEGANIPNRTSPAKSCSLDSQ